MKKKFYLLLIFLTLFTFLIFQPTNILAERNSNDTENEVEDESEPDSDSINDNNLENEVKSENEVEDSANLLDDSSDKSGDSGDEDKTQTESEKDLFRSITLYFKINSLFNRLLPRNPVPPVKRTVGEDEFISVLL
ncbi:MAG: hypothetical protein UT11_C0019G0002 [Berkelbacteria bacterium GW2011_GWA2_38_9]|uniref:Uncharacterized protein n=1 Tax=Berkelbacteria bacterium GW2011_GWA2_38_9 TaxID=1618334 RepID=A0A0G0LFD3_9BACT|nr:MAG: hypothetical protein UT11_C0019G0002 [Berkelbacteria bacterium GW2011_GWA2_38_9]